MHDCECTSLIIALEVCNIINAKLKLLLSFAVIMGGSVVDMKRFLFFPSSSTNVAAFWHQLGEHTMILSRNPDHFEFSLRQLRIFPP
jgi:hypothetical protein